MQVVDMRYHPEQFLRHIYDSLLTTGTVNPEPYELKTLECVDDASRNRCSQIYNSLRSDFNLERLVLDHPVLFRPFMELSLGVTKEAPEHQALPVRSSLELAKVLLRCANMSAACLDDNTWKIARYFIESRRDSVDASALTVAYGFFNQHYSLLTRDALKYYATEGGTWLSNRINSEITVSGFLYKHYYTFSDSCGLCNSPFMSALYRHTGQYRNLLVKTATPATERQIEVLTRLIDELIDLDEECVRIACTTLDYVLVAQTLRIFAKLHAESNNAVFKDRIIQACQGMLNITLPRPGVALSNKTHLYCKTPNVSVPLNSGVARLVFQELRSNINRLSDQAVEAEFASINKRFSRFVLASSVLFLDKMHDPYVDYKIADEVLKLLQDNATELYDPQFPLEIGKRGRLKVASLLNEIGDPDIRTEVLKNWRDVRVQVLESGFGL
jgi:hypothetical protein